MSRFLIISLFLVIAPSQAPAQSVPEIPYEAVPNFLKLPPRQYLGEATGVAVNSKGHIFVFSRSGHPQLLEFGPDGTFLRLIGEDLYGFVSPHDLGVDKDDNIWAVDVGSNMVIKFNPKGQVVMLLGRRPTGLAAPKRRPDGSSPPVPPALVSENSADFFDGPTDVAFGPNGETYVSDGHVNSQIVKFDKNGNWVKAWGKRGTAPGEFHLPHGIAADAKGNVYVSDAQNKRVQVFDPDGNFLKQWTNVSPQAICITPPPHQFVYTSASNASETGRIYKLDLQGNIVGVFGKAGKQPGEFSNALGLACPSENVIFIAEPQNWRVQKFILHPKD